MKRRTFIVGLGSAAAWPVVARAQQRAMPVVGYLDTNEPTWLAPFRKGLSETGFVEGRNVTIEYRSVPLNAINRLDRLRELAADLVSRASVIVAPNSALAHLVKAATATVPIVFRTGFDPVQDGLVESFDRPGGQITGITDISVALGRKRLQLLDDMLPRASRFGALVVDPNRPFTEAMIKDLQAGAVIIGRPVEIVRASTNSEIDEAFASLQQRRIDALLVDSNGLFVQRRLQVVTLAAHYRMPAIYPRREFAEIGGLVSYGSEFADQYRQVGIYTGRILKGEKPAERPTKFNLVINSQTAKALGLTIPKTLLATADEVIQ
jgi:putative tryptophan/tyrosine transport system substrate-binding protein